MGASLLAADPSPTVALVVAALALLGSIGAAAIALLGNQRAGEREFQAERREQYANLMAALRTGSASESLPLLIERIRQTSPELRTYLDHLTDGEPSQIDLGELQTAMDYQQKPWILRKLHLVRRPGSLRS